MLPDLPGGLTVLERGWLSSNNILCVGSRDVSVVDSGYCIHSQQTLALIQSALGDCSPALLVNTHLHSDHCGGNAALQLRYPEMRTLIPRGEAASVREWTPFEAEVRDIGQQCPRFVFQDVLTVGQTLHLGDLDWQIHASPGHDQHSVILFEPSSATLISADALWENGFGVVFSHIRDGSGFDELSSTLDLIERLAPRQVIPGHGRVFGDVQHALATARRRLDSFSQNPHKHALHAAKVLVKFKLLEVQSFEAADLADWVESSSFFGLLRQKFFPGLGTLPWIIQLAQDLQKSGAARMEGSRVFNT
jgi:glyoxylase-like metal-dependent hydrolase (beta-lactamase superfamily II)